RPGRAGRRRGRCARGPGRRTAGQHPPDRQPRVLTARRSRRSRCCFACNGRLPAMHRNARGPTPAPRVATIHDPEFSPMHLPLLKAKIHRATVTHSELNYEGSVAIDGLLLDATGIREFEQVHVWDVTNGARFTTYAIRADE